MKSKTFRTFDVDGIMYSFSFENFKNAITLYQVQQKDLGKPYLLKDISEEIATELNISVEAFSNWRKGYNGPSDIERIKEIAAVLGCDYKYLLKTKGEHKQMISKEVTLNNNNADENDVIRSILNDMQEVMDCFGKTNGFIDWKIVSPYSSEDSDDNNEHSSIDFEGWFDNIRLKMRKSEFFISRQNAQKLERLFLETLAFVDCSTLHIVHRWMDICKGFELQKGFDEIAEDKMLDLDNLLCNNEYLEEDMREYLAKELDDYIQGYICYDNPVVAIGYRIGAWYLEVIRHDFPELFID